MFLTLSATLVVTLSIMGGLWWLSTRINDVGFIDAAWPLGIIAIAWFALAHSQAQDRDYLIAGLITLWGCRLALHVYVRYRTEGEDRRYQRLRKDHGADFTFNSLYLVFLIQGGFVWFVSLPAQIALATDTVNPLGPLDMAGLALWWVGFLIEAGADAHLAIFKSKAENRRKVLDRGLWALSRHPNYFGECCLWWGIYLISASNGLAAWAFMSPVFLTHLMLNVTGIPMVERELLDRREGYAEYRMRTNAFFLGPKRTRKQIERAMAEAEEKARQKQARARKRREERLSQERLSQEVVSTEALTESSPEPSIRDDEPTERMSSAPPASAQDGLLFGESSIPPVASTMGMQAPVLPDRIAATDPTGLGPDVLLNDAADPFAEGPPTDPAPKPPPPPPPVVPSARRAPPAPAGPPRATPKKPGSSDE